ncbi:N-acetylmuramoyl-L-alanine amidase family protein [Dendrosporobacter sp. 1207_IL3150]|uniref:N-acetylmuramoyl-L-alanine amidase family protein n=1 Tax=Dendrosporobacter sp. 1207_IL3150 TaxID=3084054 RepID=UPI002FD8CEDA
MRVFHLKKPKFALCLIISLLFIGGIVVNAIDSLQNLTNKVIIIDAGHGGIDPGANRQGLNEKDINLAIALLLKEKLNAQGAKIILSRETDTELSKYCDEPKVKGRYNRDLAARLEMVDESDADMYISIHANVSTNPRRRGPECFYYAKSQSGKLLATAIQQELGRITTAQPNAHPGDYFVLRRNKVAAALVEVGYITNPEERTLLQSAEYQNKLADAIVKGIQTYYFKPVNDLQSKLYIFSLNLITNNAEHNASVIYFKMQNLGYCLIGYPVANFFKFT